MLVGTYRVSYNFANYKKQQSPYFIFMQAILDQFPWRSGGEETQYNIVIYNCIMHYMLFIRLFPINSHFFLFVTRRWTEAVRIKQ